MEAYQALEKELLHALAETCGEAREPALGLEDVVLLCGQETLRHELIDLVQEFHHRPAEELAGMIRHRLLELRFVNDNGDSMVETPPQSAVDLEVKVLVDALEKMRRSALERGLWGQAQACVPCCG